MSSPPVTAFRYEAVDARGKARPGIVDAQTPRQVRDRLRADGLFPTAIEPAQHARADSTSNVRIAPALTALVTRQLATLVRSDMPLDQALAVHCCNGRERLRTSAGPTSQRHSMRVNSSQMSAYS